MSYSGINSNNLNKASDYLNTAKKVLANSNGKPLDNTMAQTVKENLENALMKLGRNDITQSKLIRNAISNLNAASSTQTYINALTDINNDLNNASKKTESKLDALNNAERQNQALGESLAKRLKGIANELNTTNKNSHKNAGALRMKASAGNTVNDVGKRNSAYKCCKWQNSARNFKRMRNKCWSHSSKIF